MSWFNKEPSHLHRWKCVSVHNYIDTSYTKPGTNGAQSYNATYSCVDCGETKRESNYAGGHVTVQQLNSAIDFANEGRTQI